MEDVTKIRCPYCAGKIAIENEYYQELVGKVIKCPHCSDEMIIPANVEIAKQNSGGVHSLNRTQELKVAPTGSQPVIRQATGDVRNCPHCGVEVGRRDRVCITCGNKIPLPEPPPGFSQIRA